MSSEITLKDVAYSFNAALECLGDVVRDVIYSTLERNGISAQDIPLRIPDVVRILQKTIGGTAGLIVHKMLAEFRNERFKAQMRRARGDYIAETSLGRIGTSFTNGLSA
jgi:hypothetical protein